MTDAELISLYAEYRSERAFADLVQRHLNLVYSAALRQTGGSAAQAQDVSQAVFVTLAQKGASLARHPSLRGWLYMCTHHLAAKAMRADRRRRIRETAAHTMNELSAQAGLNWESVRLVIDQVMHELKARWVSLPL